MAAYHYVFANLRCPSEQQRIFDLLMVSGAAEENRPHRPVAIVHVAATDDAETAAGHL